MDKNNSITFSNSCFNKTKEEWFVSLWPVTMNSKVCHSSVQGREIDTNSVFCMFPERGTLSRFASYLPKAFLTGKLFVEWSCNVKQKHVLEEIKKDKTKTTMCIYSAMKRNPCLR